MNDEELICPTAEQLLAIFLSISCALDGCSVADQAQLRPYAVQARGKYLKHIQIHGCQPEGHATTGLPRGWAALERMERPLKMVFPDAFR